MRPTLPAALLALATSLSAQDPKPADTLRYFAMLPAPADLGAGARVIRQAQTDASLFNRELSVGALEVSATISILPAGQSAVERQQRLLGPVEQFGEAAKVGHELSANVKVDSVRTALLTLPTGPGRDAVRRAAIARLYLKGGVRLVAQVYLATGRTMAVVEIRGGTPEAQITALLHHLITLVEQRIDASRAAAAPPPAAARTPAPTPTPVNVVDYFRLRNTDYKLVNKAGQWSCESAYDERTFKCVVDIPNGFISIDDEGTGGGSVTSQMAIFKRADGLTIIATNTHSTEGGAFWITHKGDPPRFFSYAGGKFTNITRSVLLDTVTSAHFGGGAGLDIHYLLPRIGTSITAVCDDGFCAYCPTHDAHKGKMDPDDWARTAKRCLACQGRTKKEVVLAFDKAVGRFRIQP